LDCLLAPTEPDPAPIPTFGVSAGAVIHACLAGVDRRPRAHVFVLAGGPLADVLADTDEKRFRGYRQALGGGPKGRVNEPLRRRLRAALRTDPIRLAPGVRRDDVLLVLATRDTAVPYAYGRRLWEALGRPRLIELPFGHKTSFVLLPWITNEVNRFLGSRLGAP
ncbi:MAG: hypothetical protein ACC662_04250, partial [Planctomycetota bacterium]